MITNDSMMCPAVSLSRANELSLLSETVTALNAWLLCTIANVRNVFYFLPVSDLIDIRMARFLEYYDTDENCV